MVVSTSHTYSKNKNKFVVSAQKKVALHKSKIYFLQNLDKNLKEATTQILKFICAR